MDNSLLTIDHSQFTIFGARKMEQKKKPRIAILGTRGYPTVYSGYETWLKELCDHLHDQYEIHVYCHRSFFKEKPKMVNGVWLHYIPSIETKILSQITNSSIATLHALFMNYDLYFFVNMANGPFGAFLHFFGKRTAINTDGIEWDRPKWKGLGGKYFRWAAGVAARFMDVLVTDAYGMQNFYRKHFQSDSVMIAYGAHVTESHKPELIEQYGLKKDDYYLTVGRLIPDNHVEEIVTGFMKCNSPKKLVVVGGVTYKDEFATRMKAMASEKIIFTDYVRDQQLLMELYANSYCYIHGHAFGGTNPALLKALAYGCCVLAHDNKFNRETLQDDKHGYYFHGTPDELKIAVEKIDVMNEEVLQKKAISRQRITENFTWEKICRQYDELFQKLITDKKWEMNKGTWREEKQ